MTPCVQNEIDKLVLAYRNGEVPRSHLRRWADDHIGSCKRPDLSELETLSHACADDLIERLCTQDDLVREIQCTLQHWLREAVAERDDATGAAQRILEAVFELCHVFGNDASVDGPAFALGHHLWRIDHPGDAATYLEQAALGFSQQEDASDQRLAALTYLSHALLEERQHDKGLEVTKQLADLAESCGNKGALACALRNKGLHLSALGRTGAVECLTSALDLRRKLSMHEVGDVPALDTFINALATHYREEGYYDKAIEAYSELVDMGERLHDHALEAEALSDVAYTYLHAGHQRNFEKFIERAIAVARQHDVQRKNRERWEIQLGTLGHVAPVSASVVGGPPASEHDAAILAEQAQQCFARGRYEEARNAASTALDWAVQHDVINLQAICLNLIGIAAEQSGDVDGSIRALYRAIQLADHHNLADESAKFRINLALVLIQANRLQQAVNVILVGTCENGIVLSRTGSSALRQEVLASNIRLYELLALVLSKTGNHAQLAPYTEQSRAQSLGGWLLAADHVARLEPAQARETRQALLALRANAVETEIRHQTGMADLASLRRLAENRERLSAALHAACDAFGFDLPILDAKAISAKDVMDDVVSLAKADDAVLVYLYSIDEGVCIAAHSPRQRDRGWVGDFIPWERTERLELIRSLAFGARTRRSCLEILRDSAGAQVPLVSKRDGWDDLRRRLFAPLTALLADFAERNYVVFPHAELATIPYWPLLDERATSAKYSVCPSLGVYGICAHRERSTSSPALTIDDATGTLAHTDEELAAVRKWIPTTTPVHNLRELRTLGERCGTIHVAAHGHYDGENPYYSGILFPKDDAESDELMSRYLSRDGGLLRVLTCAEIMARYDFPACRLAILSACESGLTRVHGAGEMTGLPTALLIAGAKTVVASMWPVNDAATAVLMHHFWEAWQGGSGPSPSPAGALATARCALRSTTRDEAEEILGGEHGVPECDVPFSDPSLSDAFQCFGAL